MPVIPLDSINDPALEVYRNLKKSNLTRWSGLFIAEGKKLTLQLLQSDYPVHSVLCSENYIDLIQPYLRPEHTVYLVSQSNIEQVVGFNFHHGMLACGIRRPEPTLEELVPESGPVKLVVCPKIENPDNLGSIIRLSAGFGVHGILLGTGSCETFSRRTLRVSMGAAFRVPTLESGPQLADQLQWLREARGIDLVATVLDDTAEPLKQAAVSTRTALLLGNENAGLGPEWIKLCQRRVTIPMAPGTDSLNVAFAACLFLHHFMG